MQSSLLLRIGFCLCLALATGLHAEEQMDPVQWLSNLKKPLAKIGDEILTFSDISSRYAQEVERLKQNSLKVNQPLHDMMVQGLLAQEVQAVLLQRGANKANLKVPNERVLEIFNQFKNRFDDDASYQRYLDEHQWTASDILKRIEGRLKVAQFQEEVLFKDMIVDEGLIDKYLQEHQAEGEKSGFQVRQILLFYPDNATEKQKKDKVQELGQIRRTLLRGDDFGEIARRISQGATASQGGLIGWVNRDSALHPNVLKALSLMNPGDLSAVIETDNGVHLLEVMDRRYDETDRSNPSIRQVIRDEILIVMKQDTLTTYYQKAGEEYQVSLLPLHD